MKYENARICCMKKCKSKIIEEEEGDKAVILRLYPFNPDGFSSFALYNGVENMLMHYIPEVKGNYVMGR